MLSLTLVNPVALAVAVSVDQELLPSVVYVSVEVVAAPVEGRVSVEDDHELLPPKLTVWPVPMLLTMFPLASVTLTVALNVFPRPAVLHEQVKKQDVLSVPLLTVGVPVHASVAAAPAVTVTESGLALLLIVPSLTVTLAVSAL
jgi:hypothetical protein